MNLADNKQELQQILDKEVLLHRMTNRIRQSLELQEILEATVTEIRSFLKTDRVMVYRFEGDGSGEVIAESIRDSRLPSMLGLHFPADDIPASARELYVKARVRSIVDVNSQQIGLSPLHNPQTGEALGRETIGYRRVDPCHAAYLKAMGVQSSVVVPILASEQLWGLLVSHHSQPQFIFEQDLQVLQQVADQASIAIAHATILNQVRQQQALEATINRISSLLHAQPTIELQAALEATVAAFSAVGGRLYITADNSSGAVLTCGAQPTMPEWEEWLWLEKHPLWQEWLQLGFKPTHPEATVLHSSDFWAIADLYKDPQFRVLAPAFGSTRIRGVLVVPLKYRQKLLGCLSVFRQEMDAERLWAGRFDPSAKQLLPRQSFQAWRELKRGQSPSWTREDIDLARSLGYHFSMAIQQYVLYQEVQALNANLERQVHKRTAQLMQSLEFARVVKAITDQIRSTLDLKTILQTIVREVRILLNTDRVAIYQFSSDGQGEVTVEEIRGNWRSILGIKGPNNCFPDEYARLYLKGRIRAINNTAAEELTACHREFLQSLEIQANLIVPIQMESGLWGLLIAHECASPRAWQPVELEVVQQLATQAAIAIQQAELYQQSQIAADEAKAQAQQLAIALDDLRQMQTQLIQTEKMSSLGNLVAGVAHEINNPVNFIYGNLLHADRYTQDLLELLQLYQQYYPNPCPEILDYIEQVELEFLVEDLPKILSSMKVGADRICQIVLSLRNFSRLEQSEMKAVDIHEGIDSTLLILHHRLKAKSDRPGIQVIKDYGNLPLVECYAGQINQVFMNVLANAIDALDEYDKQRSLLEIQKNPSRITIRTTLRNELMGQGQEERFVTICIADNGPGIPETVRSRIFEPFFTTKPIGKGTGIGLSISRQIVVEKHGGAFNCLSQPGLGTEFWIEIPVAQRPVSSVPQV